MNPKITVVQDGKEVDLEIKQQFFNSSEAYEEQDLSVYQQKSYINFVGVILKDNHFLISLPKNFYTDEQLKKINQSPLEVIDDFHLLMKVVLKAAKVGVKGLNEDSHHFPLSAFVGIYEYYLNYGLYFEESHHTVDGYSGKVNWRKTIQQVTPLGYQGNLIYMPLKVEKKNRYDTFITQAMAYVINDVSNKLSLLFNIKSIEYPYNPVEFQNKAHVLQVLYQCRQHIFKDLHLKLIDHLITYFKSEQENKGQFALKLHSFHTIWENIVQCYLQNFDRIENDTMIFTESIPMKRHFKKKTLKPDASEHNYTIEFDHYYVDKERKERYIFDSKYYTEKSDLDYKQLSYYFLTKDIEEGISSNIDNTKLALILPSENNYDTTEIQFELKERYNKEDAGLKLYHYYLPIKWAMHKYIQS